MVWVERGNLGVRASSGGRQGNVMCGGRVSLSVSRHFCFPLCISPPLILLTYVYKKLKIKEKKGNEKHGLSYTYSICMYVLYIYACNLR